MIKIAGIFLLALLKNGKHKYRFTFGQSIVKVQAIDNKPTAYDVLATIEKYDIGSV
jgi:hypothetical protein